MHLSCLPQVLNPVTESCQLKGQADRLNGQDGKLKFTWRGEEVRESLEGTSYQVSKARKQSDTFPLLVHLQKTADIILDIASQVKLDFVGHRVVHGGERFKEATEITEETLMNLTDIQGKLSLFLNIIYKSVVTFCRFGSIAQPYSDPSHQTGSVKV